MFDTDAGFVGFEFLIKTLQIQNRESLFSFSVINWFLAIFSSAVAFFGYFFALLQKSDKYGIVRRD